MLRAVIFDLDGVIVDSHPAHLQAWKRFFRSIGKDVPAPDLLFILEGQKREDILRVADGKLAEYWGDADSLLFIQQLGVREVPAQG